MMCHQGNNWYMLLNNSVLFICVYSNKKMCLNMYIMS